MKPTNEERRKVAERLRALASHREVDKEFVHDALGLYMGECIDGYDPVGVMELADLIEPEPERTCHLRETDHDYEASYRCDACKRVVWIDWKGNPRPNYCPKCGAKVVE